MNATTRRAPLSRLLQIVMALQSDRRPNALRLAEECEVSRRTIFRDLEAIEGAGLTVEYDASRQGYRLAQAGAVKPAALEESEVVALALLVNAGADAGAFGLTGPARSALAKLIGGLPEGSRRRAEALDRATRDDGPAPAADEARQAVHRVVLEAIARRVQIRLTIREPGREAEMTLLTPYRLLSRAGEWSVVGRSSADRGVRLIPLALVEAAEPTEAPATVPPRFRAERWLGPTGEVGRFRGPGWLTPPDRALEYDSFPANGLAGA